MQTHAPLSMFAILKVLVFSALTLLFFIIFMSGIVRLLVGAVRSGEFPMRGAMVAFHKEKLLPFWRSLVFFAIMALIFGLGVVGMGRIVIFEVVPLIW